MVNPIQATSWKHLVCRPSGGLGWMSSDEHRSFGYYQLKALPQFSTIFEDSFWSQTIPQMAHSESSIQHGLAALSSFHETSFAGVTRDQSDEGMQRNALKQYNHAIRELSGKSSSTVPIEIQLTTCLIFVNIEVRFQISTCCCVIYLISSPGSSWTPRISHQAPRLWLSSIARMLR